MTAPPAFEPPYGDPKIPERGSDGNVSVPPIVVRDDGGVRVTRTDQVDFGRAKGSAGLTYVYRFAMYEIAVADRMFRARRYADEWSVVAIYRGEGAFEDVPYDDPAFSIVARYFLRLSDVRAVQVFAGTEYVAVDPERLIEGG